MEAKDPDEARISEPEFSVAALTCSADRMVFTEDDNDDGWISTDTTAEIRR